MEKQITLLADCGMKADTIAKVLGISENAVHEALDNQRDALEAIEREYYERELPRVLKEVEEMKKEMPAHEAREMRRQYLLGRIQEIKPLYLASPTEELRKELQSLLFEAKVYTGESEGFTAVEVARARLFPITRLIRNQREMALCPFHPDKSPSLNLKNNFYYCHGCGIK